MSMRLGVAVERGAQCEGLERIRKHINLVTHLKVNVELSRRVAAHSCRKASTKDVG